jgi:Mg2+ and Co2+ transporter CorA
MLQAEGVVKLTRLAFVFIALSFTTTFFGMNFKEFGIGSQSIWEWFIASLPILTVTILLMRYDVSVLWRRRGGSTGKHVEEAPVTSAKKV